MNQQLHTPTTGPAALPAPGMPLVDVPEATAPELLRWVRVTPQTMPDAEITVLGWIELAGTSDWASVWWDGEHWRDCASGDTLAGQVVRWAQPRGPAQWAGADALPPTEVPGGTPVQRPVVRPVPQRASECGLTECRGKPMCTRCAYAAGVQLKPCPWCWHEGEFLLDLWDNFDAGHIAHVHCSHCGADGPSVYSENGADSAIKDARHRWNSRMVRGA